MAQVTNLLERIKDFAGTLLDNAADNDAIQQLVSDGCHDVIDKLKKTDDFDVHRFVEASGAEEDASGLNTENLRSIEYAERNGYPCRRVSETQRQFVDNDDSIYKATSDDPVYYIFNGTAFIKPNPTVGESGYFYFIRNFDTNNAMDSTPTFITGFPKEYLEHVVLYASYMLLGKMLLNLIQDVTADSDLSLETISLLMNADKPNTGLDVWAYLEDEDSEMAQATMAAIQSASALNKQKYDYYKDRMMNLKAEYMGKFNFQAPGGQA